MTKPNSGIPLGQWSGSDATNALRESLERFNAQSSKQTDQIIRLTLVLLWLTVIMTIGLIVQIGLTMKQLQWF